MQTLIVQLPGHMDERGVARLLKLGPGDEARFGRGAPGHPVEIELADPAVSRVAGRICGSGDHWLISNLSSNTYVVENPEGGGEFVKVAPRRLDMPVPFEFGRVVLPARQGSLSFMVYAPQHAYADARALDGSDPDGTIAPFSLDETAKYFLVLVALCEARLRDRSPAGVPGASEIVERLRPLPGFERLTRSAVNFHLDYLARHKLRIEVPPGTGGRAKAEREALVSLSLRFDLVREEHLSLLPSRTRLSPPGRRAPAR